MKKIGGENAKDAIYRSLKAVFANELGVQCTWYGRNEKFAVQSLDVIKIISGKLGWTLHKFVYYKKYVLSYVF